MKLLEAQIFHSEGLGLVVVLAIAVIRVTSGGVVGVGGREVTGLVMCTGAGEGECGGSGGLIIGVSEVDAVEGFLGVWIAH